MFLNPIYGIEYGVYVHLYPFLDFDVELHTNAISPAFVRNGGTLEDLFFASYLSTSPDPLELGDESVRDTVSRACSSLWEDINFKILLAMKCIKICKFY